MIVTLNKTEYRAINDLRGLPAAAHMLVMCSRLTETGGTLDGSIDAFDELVGDIGERLAEGELSATAARTLRRVCAKIDPDCADWLGL